MNSLRTIFARTVLCLLCATLLASCRVPWKQAHMHSNLANVPKPTTQQLLSSLQKNFRQVKTFHVLMQVQNPGTAQSNQIQIRSANGDILMPDKIKAQATVMLSGQSVSINLISIGANQYITDPITGQWRQVQGILDPRTLTNPNTGIISLIGKVHNVSQPVSDAINNVPCWRVQGQLSAQDLAFLTGGGMPAGALLQTSACIGKGDNLPYIVTVTGQASPSDTAQTVRSFLLSNYNQNVTVQAPQI
jgi:LppX_LprAFG lipoprotein